MIEILTISIIAWWVSVGSNLIQTLKWKLKLKRLPILDCPKCLGFWSGLVYFFTTGNPMQYVLIYAILSSCFAIIIEKGIARL